MGPRGLSPLTVLQMYRMGMIDSWTLYEALTYPHGPEDEFETFIKFVRADFGRDLWDPED